jgi:3-oxoacyl-[acyl-carrier protein] reductase
MSMHPAMTQQGAAPMVSRFQQTGGTGMGKLDGKVAIVTGAARGLGRAYALRLAGLGAKVAVTDINLKSYQEFEAEAKAMTADSTVDEINAITEAIGIEMDVRDEGAVQVMARQVMDTWGRIDILVCNAGGGRGRPIDTRASTLDSSLLHLVTEMNYYGTVYCVNAVAPVMKAQHSGKIVTVSSIAGLGPSVDGGYAHYGAAKAAILHYTRYLAQDLGPHGITVNCIAPGIITTGRIVASVMPGSADANTDRAEKIAVRRLGSVEDCAKVVEFLTTDLSDYVTGQCIAIDGGMVRSA